MEKESVEQVRERAEQRWKSYREDVLQGKVLTRMADLPIHVVSIFAAYPSDKALDANLDEMLDDQRLPLLGLSKRKYLVVDQAVEVLPLENGNAGQSHAAFMLQGTVLAATVAPALTYFHKETGLQGIAITGIAEETIKFLSKSFSLLLDWGQKPPWFVGFGALRLPKCRLFPMRGGDPDRLDHEFPGGDIVPDLIMIDSADGITDFHIAARRLSSLFDFFWRQFKVDRCLDYDEQGNWID